MRRLDCVVAHGHDTGSQARGTAPATQPRYGRWASDTAGWGPRHGARAATIVVKRKQYVFYISVCKIYFFRTALVIYFLFFLV